MRGEGRKEISQGGLYSFLLESQGTHIFEIGKKERNKIGVSKHLVTG